MNGTTIGRSAEVVRRLPGPIVERWCTRVPREEASDGEPRFQWIERLRFGAGDSLTNVQIRNHSSDLPASDGVAAAVPARSFELTIWPHVQIQGLLFDVLFGADMPGTPTLEQILGDLGAWLRMFHTHDHTTDPVIRTRPPWTGTAGEIATAMNEHRGPVLAHLISSFDVSSRPVSEPPVRTRIHGRFGTSMVVPGATSVVLLSGDGGHGDPLADLAHLLGELVECASLINGAFDRVTAAGRAFVQRYGDVDRDRLRQVVVHRLADHLCLRLAVSDGDRGTAELLDLVTARGPGAVDAILGGS